MRWKTRPLLVPLWTVCFSWGHHSNQAAPLNRVLSNQIFDPVLRGVGLLFVVDSPLNSSQLQVQLCCKGITYQNTSNRQHLQRQTVNLSNKCVICREEHFKTKIINAVYFPKKESFDRSQLQCLFLSFHGFLSCLSQTSLHTLPYKHERRQ